MGDEKRERGEEEKKEKREGKKKDTSHIDLYINHCLLVKKRTWVSYYISNRREHNNTDTNHIHHI